MMGYCLVQVVNQSLTTGYLVAFNSRSLFGSIGRSLFGSARKSLFGLSDFFFR